MANSQQGSLDAVPYSKAYPNADEADLSIVAANFKFINDPENQKVEADMKEARKSIKVNSPKDVLGRKKAMRIVVIDPRSEEAVGEIVFATKNTSATKAKPAGTSVSMSLQAPAKD